MTPKNRGKGDESKDALVTASAGVLSPHVGAYGGPHHGGYYPPPYPPPYYDYGPHSGGGYQYPPHGYPPHSQPYHYMPPSPEAPPYAYSPPYQAAPPSSQVHRNPQPPHFPEVDSDRKLRKNGQARQRSAHNRQLIADIEAKPEEERTEEEAEMLRRYIERRDHKNTQSRERAQLKKDKEAYIMGKPEHERTAEEQEWLEEHNSKRSRKHEGDRLRRQRIKELGISSRIGHKPGVSARGPLPPQYQAILEEKGGTAPPRAL